MSDSLPQEVIDEVNQILIKYDQDKDNEITWFEIYNHFLDENVENPEVMTMIVFDNLDKNMDGVIQVNEIEQIKYQNYVLKNNIKNDLNELLNSPRINLDYTYDQVLEIIKSNPAYKEPERVTKIIFKMIDLNNDNIINSNEIKHYIETLLS